MIDVNDLTSISTDCSMTEFVGTTVLDTIGLVIPGIDPALLEQMAQCDLPFCCPHGRPTVIHLSKQEIERRFGRR